MCNFPDFHSVWLPKLKNNEEKKHTGNPVSDFIRRYTKRAEQLVGVSAGMSDLGSDWPEMGQNRDFFRSDFSIFWLADPKCTEI